MASGQKCPKCGSDFSRNNAEWVCSKCNFRMKYDPEVEQWLSQLEEKYRDAKVIPQRFEEDCPLLRVDLPKLKDDLTKRFSNIYRIEEAIGVGGTSVVFRVSHSYLPHGFAIKFNRPKLPEAELSILENERTILPKLNHFNIIRIIESGKIDVDVPHSRRLTYIMEPLITKPKTIRDYVDALLAQCTKEDTASVNRVLRELVNILRQWVEALTYVHGQNYVYFDVKPSNALVDSTGKVVVIDFGSAKEYDPKTVREIDDYDRYEETGYFDSLMVEGKPILEQGDQNITTVFFTIEYAHKFLLRLKYDPTSTRRIKAGIKKDFIHPRFDCYALGKSILELLNRIASVEESEVPNLRLFRYLHLLATRLLDEQNESGGKKVANEIFGGLKKEDYRSIKYLSMTPVLLDLEKETGSWNPEIEIPELGSFSKETVRIGPNLNVALTDRLLSIVKHPLFARLKQTKELGLVSLVYPTAEHTRFDHILGTYAHVTNYIKSLYNDEQNPLFRNLVDAQDLKATLLAALLHDLGQYPLAHDLEEVNKGIFGHQMISIDLIEDPTPDKRRKQNQTLMKIIENEWKVDLGWLKDILRTHSKQPKLPVEKKQDKTRIFKMDMLSALIDGPIDADKADYVIRDSVACGVPYGNAVDLERLLHVLTVALNPKEKPSHRVTVGVYAKGRGSAESLGLARYLLYSTVYWHHTSRILKAMLQYATALLLPTDILSGLETKKTDETRDSIRRDLVAFIKSLAPPFEQKPTKQSKKAQGVKPSLDEVIAAGKASEALEQYLPSSSKETEDRWYPGIAWTDWLMLRWLKKELCRDLSGYKVDTRATALLDCIMARDLYKRVATIPRPEGEDEKGLAFDFSLLPWSKKIDHSKALQEKIKDRVLKSWDDFSTSTLEIQEEGAAQLFKHNLCILIDAPNPEDKLGYSYDRPLLYVPELKQKTYYQEVDEPPQEGKSVRMLWRSIAPLRVLCHPALLQPISKAIHPAHQEMSELIREVMQS